MPVEIRIPSVGESITEVQLGDWVKAEGDSFGMDEKLIELESEKATFDLSAPTPGVLVKILIPSGSAAKVGDVAATYEPAPAGAKSPAPKSAAPAPAASSGSGTSSTTVMPAAAKALAQQGARADQVQATGPGGRLLKEDVARGSKSGGADGAPASNGLPRSARDDEAIPMSPMRKRIASRLVEAQQTAALLTTFNEVDMSAVRDLRAKFKDTYEQRYGIKLGFMSFFVKAAVDALKAFPQVNAEIRGTDIVYHHYYDIGIAIGGGKGLVVPVLRNTERLSFSEIERGIAAFAKKAKENALGVADLQGGTFTISNGGVYGSMLSTPIVNPPQSAILGMHSIEDRAVVRDGQIVIRPIMYLALTYDHRIVDGREAVTFLKRIKDCIEDPTRMLLEI